MKSVFKSHKPLSVSFNVYQLFTEITVFLLENNAVVKKFFFKEKYKR